MKVDYSSKQLKDLHCKYQAIALEASSFIVEQGKLGSYTDSTSYLRMPTHLFSEEEVEEKFVGVPMFRKCYNHMVAVLASRADLKASKASGLVRVWPHQGVLLLPDIHDGKGAPDGLAQG